MEKKESSLRRFMVSEDTVPLEAPVVEDGKDPIITNHPYFTERPAETFLDEDAAVNINNSEMTTTPKEYE
ncbi:hypothetical protein [Ammoniphilus sp. 3BR4]|uniref:hypothetical protein n=1 Tax=Ammoniphilus sp. 3BR4 TaxID=3158265 RepID=UPI003466861D